MLTRREEERELLTLGVADRQADDEPTRWSSNPPQHPPRPGLCTRTRRLFAPAGRLRTRAGCPRGRSPRAPTLSPPRARTC